MQERGAAKLKFRLAELQPPGTRHATTTPVVATATPWNNDHRHFIQKSGVMQDCSHITFLFPALRRAPASPP